MVDDGALAFVAHLIGGNRLHIADAVLYGLAAIGLGAGIALFASGRSGRAAQPGDASTAASGDPAIAPSTPLVKVRAPRPAPRRRRN